MRATGLVAGIGFALLAGGGGGAREGAGFGAADRGGFEARGASYRATVAADGAIGVQTAGSASAVELRTAGLGRAGGPAAPGRAPILEADGAVAIDRGVAVERLHVEPAGIEQSFAFAERPAGSGDLTLRLAVRRGSPGGASPDGVRLAATDGAALAYGHAVWVDAAGARTELTPRFEGDEIVVRVAAAVVERSAYPAVLDPTLGKEVDVAPSGGLGWAGVAPALAAGDGGYLAAWQTVGAGVEGIVAVHLDGKGTPLDGGYFPVSHDAADAGAGVAWAGGRYLVTYADGTTGGRPYASEVNGTTVAPPLDLSSDPKAGDHADKVFVAPILTNFGVVWTKSSSSLGGRFFIDSTHTATQFPVTHQAVATLCGSRSAMFYGFRDGGPQVVRVNAGGTASAPVLVSQSTNTSAPVVATQSAEALAVWFDKDTFVVMGAYVTWSVDTLVADTPFEIFHATNPTISVATGGSRFWVTIFDDIPGAPELNTASVENGTVTPSSRAHPDGLTTGLATACDSSGCVALLTGPDDALLKFRFGSLGVSDDPDPVPIGKSAMMTSGATMATHDGGYLVAFDARSSEASEVDGAFLDAAGDVAQYKPLADVFQGSSGLAVEGTSYWLFGNTGDSDTIQVIPEKSGDPHPFLSFPSHGLDVGHDTPDVACSPDRCLVIDSDGTELTGVAFDAVKGLEVPVRGFGSTLPGHVAFGAGVYAVSSTGSSRAFVTIVDLAGSSPKVGTPTEIKEAFPDRAPWIAFDGQDFVAVWTEPGADRATRIRAVRVDRSGKRVGDIVDVTANGGTSVQIAPLADGAASVVAWTEPGPPSRACVARFANGRVVDAPPICVDDTNGDATSASGTVAGSPGHAVLVYERRDSRIQYQTVRVKVRTLEFGDGPGAKCTPSTTGASGPTCSSSFCSDGVCCDAPCAEACRACGADGHCGIVASKEDPGRCDGDRSCSADGACLGGPGAQCERNEQCLLAHCVGPEGEGTCCNQACGSCQRCNAAGACEAMSTDGCVGTCTSSADCPTGMLCNDVGSCEKPPPDPTELSDCAVASAGADGPRSLGGAAALGLAAALLGLRRRRNARRARP